MAGAGLVRFLVTDEGVRLARWLRLMGYDAASMAARPLSALYRSAYRDGRIIVTRNRRVRPGRLLRVIQLESQEFEEQLRQVMRACALALGETRMFSRCDACNVPLEPAEKAQVKDRVPPYVFQTQQAFRRCPACQRIYWAATHSDRIRTRLKSVSDA
jgi:uncharacterized protein with PIN domain